jgi:hypothetical protein
MRETSQIDVPTMQDIRSRDEEIVWLRAMIAGPGAGQVAFEAYNNAKGGLTWDGKPIPPWSAVGPEVQNGWRVAAAAVLAMQKDPEDINGWDLDGNKIPIKE